MESVFKGYYLIHLFIPSGLIPVVRVHRWPPLAGSVEGIASNPVSRASRVAVGIPAVI
jgi:hypothetical protein